MTPSEKRIDMTPIEKANDLVNKMFNCDNSTPEKSMAMLLIHAKQCALIAVDEIFDIAYWQLYESGGEQEEKYWQEVKKEIEKL